MKKKKGITLVISGGMPRKKMDKPVEEPDYETDEDEMSGMQVASKELIDGIKKEDAEMVMRALQNFMVMHELEYEDEMEE